jgi:chromate transport protein ChrA
MTSNLLNYLHCAAVCQVKKYYIEGPTSTQLIIAIASLVTNNYVGGIIAFGMFAGPAALIMFISGLCFKYMDDVKLEIPLIYQ